MLGDMQLRMHSCLLTRTCFMMFYFVRLRSDTLLRDMLVLSVAILV